MPFVVGLRDVLGPMYSSFLIGSSVLYVRVKPKQQLGDLIPNSRFWQRESYSDMSLRRQISQRFPLTIGVGAETAPFLEDFWSGSISP